MEYPISYHHVTQSQMLYVLRVQHSVLLVTTNLLPVRITRISSVKPVTPHVQQDTTYPLPCWQRVLVKPLQMLSKQAVYLAYFPPNARLENIYLACVRVSFFSVTNLFIPLPTNLKLRYRTSTISMPTMYLPVPSLHLRSVRDWMWRWVGNGG